jgi:hypothetical protein
MTDNITQNYTPVMVGGYVRVTGHLIGRSLIDSLRGTFATGGLLEQGDYFMDQSRDLLEKHLQLIFLRDQTTIRYRFLMSVFSVCVALPSNNDV